MKNETKSANNTKLKMPIYAIIALLTAFAVITATAFCWLKDGNALIFPSTFNGSATPAYFAGGDGSAKNPYEISNAVHLYNLAWLQYLGYFNMREDTNADGEVTSFNNKLTQSHFVLKNNIDMKGRAIPPIGTTEYPFIGTFDGANYTIRHLTVANEKGDSLLKIIPSNAKWSGTMLTRLDGDGEISVLGMFGVVGNYDNYVATYKAAHADFSESVMKVSSFYIDLLHVKSSSASTLCGLAAGYVGGNLSKIGVYKSDINFVSGATGIAALSGGDTVLSKYSLVGSYDEKLVTWDATENVPTRDWGGSIDMRTLNRRLNYMYNLGTVTTGGIYKTSESSVYHSKLSLSKSTTFFWNAETSQNEVFYIEKNTYVPLNIDEVGMGLKESVQNADGTYDLEIKFYNDETAGTYVNEKYKGANGETYSEILADENTGYIVGGSNLGKTMTCVRSAVRPLSTALHRSFGSTATSGSNSNTITYDGGNMEVIALTADPNNSSKNKAYRLTDGYAGTSGLSNAVPDAKSASELNLNKYSKVKGKFDKSMGALTYVHGIRFYQAADEYLTASDVKIGSETYGSYQLKTGGINFHVSESGYLTALMGMYNSGTRGFNLYTVSRESDQNIDTVKEIQGVYTDKNGNIYYEFKDSSGNTYYDTESGELPSDATKRFSFSDFTNTRMISGAAYYVEIPVKLGDYFFGSNNGYSCYLMYLDIGANGDEEVTRPADKSYKMESVDFVNIDTVPLNAANEKYYPEYDTVLIALGGVNQSNAAYVVFIRDSDLTDGAYKLKYRTVYLTAKDLSEKYAYVDPDGVLAPFPDG